MDAFYKTAYIYPYLYLCLYLYLYMYTNIMYAEQPYNIYESLYQKKFKLEKSFNNQKRLKFNILYICILIYINLCTYTYIYTHDNTFIYQCQFTLTI